MRAVLSTKKALIFHKWQLHCPQIRACFSTNDGCIVHKEGLVCPQVRVYVSTTQGFDSPQVWDRLSTIAGLFSDTFQIPSGMVRVLLCKVFKTQQLKISPSCALLGFQALCTGSCARILEESFGDWAWLLFGGQLWLSMGECVLTWAGDGYVHFTYTQYQRHII